MNCEYVQQYYKVPAAIGRLVVCNGNPGIIAEDRGNYIGVNFDKDKPGIVYNVHPTDGVIYGEMGVIRKPSRSAARYQDYLHSESSLSFPEWLGIKFCRRCGKPINKKNSDCWVCKEY